MGLLGKNGTGKTTTINILMGFLRPQSGECMIFGENITELKPETRARIALLIEGHIQYSFMTIEEIEKFYSHFYSKWNRDVYYELMKKLHVSPHQKISTMSCGQRSQVALGLILAQNADLLVLDNFSLGLDPGYRRLFVEYLKEYTIACDTIEKSKSARFNEIFNKSGFKYPVKSYNSDITSRKPYDEGYLLADAAGEIFHMKMQAGRPYLRKVVKPDSVIAEHVFILENIDRRQLGLVVDNDKNLYVLEKEDYKLIKLPVGKVDPSQERITIVKNIFNWVIKISDEKQSRWVALESGSYMPLGEYCVKYAESTSYRIKQYIFPYSLTFTSVDDCFVKPHISDISWYAIFLNIILAGTLIFKKHRFYTKTTIITLFFGIFTFIPFTLIKH